jgi:hypothetical protein
MFSVNSTKLLRFLASRRSKQAKGLKKGRKNANAVCNSSYKHKLVICYVVVYVVFLISFGRYHLIRSPVQEKEPTQLRNAEKVCAKTKRVFWHPKLRFRYLMSLAEITIYLHTTRGRIKHPISVPEKILLI